MTALGREHIIKSIRDRSLNVSPILSPNQIGASSVDLRIGNVVLTVRRRRASHVDPVTMHQGGLELHDQEVQRQQKHERHEIPFLTPFLLHPGALALVPTLEWIGLPDNLLGLVTARSSWAREGLNIATATFIEPNYRGIITLELTNLGQIPITLYPGLAVAQIAFFSVSGKTARKTDSQFNMSFEPRQGNIVGENEAVFLPLP